MIEELYIKKDGESHKVDLNTPSGITLNFKSPLFNDLSKIECSHSYSFRLPITTLNQSVFNVSNDIRAEKNDLGKRYDCEYIVDGVPIVTDGYIYIQETNEEFIAVMTWEIVKGLQKLNESDETIRSLGRFENVENIAFANDKGQFIGIQKFIEVEDDPNDRFDDDGSGGNADYESPDLEIEYPDYE